MIEATISRCLEEPGIEVLVIDGGSSDDTVDRAENSGASVLHTERNRARQMNFGATRAKGDILIFLHSDTLLPSGFARHAASILDNPEIVAGAFRLYIGANSPSLRLIERGVNWRSRFLSAPYGDQAIFLTAQTFHSLGGYADLEIMEDFDLMRRLRKTGRIGLAAAPVTTSARRWERLGPWRTTLINQIAVVAYYIGVSPARIAKFYNRQTTR